MQRILIFIILLLLIPLAYAEESIYNAKDINIRIKVDTGFIIEHESEDYNIEHVKAYLSFYPQNTWRQELIAFETDPESSNFENKILFTWEKPSKVGYDFSVDAKVRTHNKYLKIKEKVSFPLTSYPNEINEFTLPTDIINSDDPDIIKIASNLAQGEDDLYKVTFKVAQWVKGNIDYSLSTVTQKASKEASWVLENKIGVCDELTSLFIAMLRSVDVPARFVSGIAYTNSDLFEERWGAHGWAEVYFPGYGWVPFDVTYGQFGFIDASHITMAISNDAGEASINYNWLGRNIDLSTKELDLNTEIISQSGTAEDPIKMDIEVQGEKTGFGSYNLVKATIENTADYYVSTEVYLSEVSEVTMLDKNHRQIILPPGKKEEIFWVIKITDELRDNYLYTIPVEIHSVTNKRASTNFEVKSTYPYYSKKEIVEIKEIIEKKEVKNYNSDVELDCDIEEKTIYVSEKLSVSCNVRNAGNTDLKDIYVCLKENCAELNLLIGQEDSFILEEKPLSAGEKVSSIELVSNSIKQSEEIKYTVLDRPIIKINDLKYPQKVRYGDVFSVNFVINITGSPLNTRVEIVDGKKVQSWDIGDLPSSRKMDIELNARDLSENNNLEIKVYFQDNYDKEFFTKETIKIELIELTFWQKVMVWFNSLF